VTLHAVFEGNINFEGGIAARIENLAGNNGFDFRSHFLAFWFSVRIFCAVNIGKISAGGRRKEIATHPRVLATTS
jgi:hypothetical protein